MVDSATNAMPCWGFPESPIDDGPEEAIRLWMFLGAEKGFGDFLAVTTAVGYAGGEMVDPRINRSVQAAQATRRGSCCLEHARHRFLRSAEAVLGMPRSDAG